jgi:hypothetical protein
MPMPRGCFVRCQFRAGQSYAADLAAKAEHGRAVTRQMLNEPDGAPALPISLESRLI